jgi:hypothetical protein
MVIAKAHEMSKISIEFKITQIVKTFNKEGKTLQEISELTKMSQEEVQNRLSRIR